MADTAIKTTNISRKLEDIEKTMRQRYKNTSKFITRLKKTHDQKSPELDWQTECRRLLPTSMNTMLSVTRTELPCQKWKTACKKQLIRNDTENKDVFKALARSIKYRRQSRKIPEVSIHYSDNYENYENSQLSVGSQSGFFNRSTHHYRREFLKSYVSCWN